MFPTREEAKALRWTEHLRSRRQSALQTSIMKKALPRECLFRCCGYLFSFSCSLRSFLIRFFSLSTLGQGQEKPSLALHQRVSG